MNFPAQPGEVARGTAWAACAASAEPLTVGHVGFGPAWQDDETSLRAMYEQACQTIVRMECEAQELQARIAVLEEEQRILARAGAPRLTDEDDGRETCRHKEAADRIGGNFWSNI
jgi:hypothetical protein